MHKSPIFAITLIALSHLFTPATAQIIYKCDESYSAQACPGGVIVNAADQRTKDQKDQADRSTARDLRTANELESARLQQEAKDIAANTPPRPSRSVKSKPDKKSVQRATKVKTIRIKTPPVKKTTAISAKKTVNKKLVKS